MAAKKWTLIDAAEVEHVTRNFRITYESNPDYLDQVQELTAGAMSASTPLFSSCS